VSSCRCSDVAQAISESSGNPSYGIGRSIPFPCLYGLAWLGHSERIADQFYQSVTDEHFRRAVCCRSGGTKSGTKNGTVGRGIKDAWKGRQRCKSKLRRDLYKRMPIHATWSKKRYWALLDSTPPQNPAGIRLFRLLTARKTARWLLGTHESAGSRTVGHLVRPSPESATRAVGDYPWDAGEPNVCGESMIRFYRITFTYTI
jgi:hypothetical protein